MGRKIEVSVDNQESGPILRIKSTSDGKPDSIRWKTKNKPYTVRFASEEQSPFTKAQYTVMPNQPATGELKDGVQPGEYAYEIVKGAKPDRDARGADPKVIIQN